MGGARVLLFYTLSQTCSSFIAWLFFGFPYANHIHCIFALRQVRNLYDLLRIPLVGCVLCNIITWRRLWKYGFPWYNRWYIKYVGDGTPWWEVSGTAFEGGLMPGALSPFPLMGVVIALIDRAYQWFTYLSKCLVAVGHRGSNSEDVQYIRIVVCM